MRLIILLSHLFWTSQVFAEVTLEEVLRSTDQHYPEIKQILSDIKGLESEMTSKEGVFDTKLEIDGYSREEGYYSGDFVKVKLKKNLPVYGVSVYGGYKISDGTFPEYEGEMRTLDGGEYSMGFSIPLLRNREIDLSRLEVFLAKNKISKQEIKLIERKILIREMAMSSYWSWIATGKTLEVYQRLFDIAKEREVALKKKLKRGDIAKIYLTENQQYILKRQAKLIEAKNYFSIASRNLSLFLRGKEGLPIVPTFKSLNRKYLFEEALKSHDYNKYFDGIIESHPELLQIDNKIQMYQLIEKSASVDLMPQFDFGAEIRKDVGDGAYSLDGEDRRLMFQFSFPFANRKARGKLNSAKILQKSMALKRQLKQEKLSLKLRNLIETIDANKQVFLNGQEEVKLAKKLEKAEQKRFFQGDSDFFVVNLREQMTAEAQIRNIQSALKVNKNKSKFQALVMRGNLKSTQK